MGGVGGVCGDDEVVVHAGSEQVNGHESQKGRSVECTLGGSVRKTDIGFPGTVSSAIFLSLASETLSTHISSN